MLHVMLFIYFTSTRSSTTITPRNTPKQKPKHISQHAKNKRQNHTLQHLSHILVCEINGEITYSDVLINTKVVEYSEAFKTSESYQVYSCIHIIYQSNVNG